MLNTLLASGARPGGSKGGVAASVLLHGLLIGSALVLSARAVRSEPEKEKLEEHVTYVAPKPEPKPLEEPRKVYVAPKKEAAPKVAQKSAPRPQPVQPKPLDAPKPRSMPPLPKPVEQVAAAPAAPMVKIPTEIPPVTAPLASVATDLADKAAKAAANELASRAKEAADAAASKSRTTSESAGDVSAPDRATYDESEVDKEVQPIGGTPTPRYPEHLRSANISGAVQVRFVVGTNGRVEDGSIKILSSPDDAFSDAVRNALRSARYRPAEAHGHKVRQLVEQSFTFRLEK